MLSKYSLIDNILILICFKFYSQVNGPFVIIFHSDNIPGAIRPDNTQNNVGNNVNQNARNELGFALDYKITSNCAPLDFVTPPAQQ